MVHHIVWSPYDGKGEKHAQCALHTSSMVVRPCVHKASLLSWVLPGDRLHAACVYTKTYWMILLSVSYGILHPAFSLAVEGVQQRTSTGTLMA